MANIERGEVDITVMRQIDGVPVERIYTLKLSMNAAVQLEQRTKKKIGELLGEASSLDFTAIRDLIYLLLQKHHAKEIKSLSEAGEFIDDAGGVKVFFETLDQLGKANAPEDTDRPPTAPASGTGDVSTETLVESV